MASRPTRRQLLVGGIGAAAAGRAGLTASSAQGFSLPHSVQDGKLLGQLVDATRILEYGCEQSLRSGKLHHDARGLVALILRHERAYLAVLESRLLALRLPGSQAQPTTRFPPAEVASLFKDIKDEVVALQGIVQIGNLAQHDYWNAAGSFNDARLARLAGEILAVEAQHWTLVVALLHRGDAIQAVPHPAVRGAEQISAPHTEVGGPR